MIYLRAISWVSVMYVVQSEKVKALQVLFGGHSPLLQNMQINGQYSLSMGKIATFDIFLLGRKCRLKTVRAIGLM